MTTEIQDQIIESEEKVGEEQIVDTAATEGVGLQREEETEGLSVEDIISGKPEEEPKTDVQKAKAGTPKGIQKRIDELTAKAKSLAEENKKLKLVQSAPQVEPLVPVIDNFDTVEDYQKAMSQYQKDIFTYNQAQVHVVEQTESQKERDDRNAAVFESQAAELKEKFPDIYDLVGKTHYGNARELIADSEHNARLGLYYAKNPDELAKIASLTNEVAIAKEIGKLEARFSKKSNITKAPAPLNPVKGEAPISTKDPKDMTDDEWFKWDQAERLRKLKQAQGG